MNDGANRSELNTLKAELQRVDMDLRMLRAKAEQIEMRIAAQDRAATQAVPPIIQPPPLVAPVIAPPPPPAPAPKTIYVPPREISKPTPPPAAPPIISLPMTAKSIPTPAPEPLPAAPRGSFEMRLGTFWFVRIGIVMVLTALVFLANYAYHHYVDLLGPLGKVVL